MAQTEAKTENRPRVYGNFRTPTSKGLAGLSTAGTVLLIGGVVGGILLMMLNLWLVALAFEAVILTLIALSMSKNKHGRTLIERIVRRAGWANTVYAGANVYRAGPVSRVPSGTTKLPGISARSRITEHVDGYGRPFALLEVPQKHHYTVVFSSEPDGGGMVDQEHINRWVDRWAHWLGMLTDEPGLTAASVTIETAPDSGYRLARKIEARMSRERPGLRPRRHQRDRADAAHRGHRHPGLHRGDLQSLRAGRRAHPQRRTKSPMTWLRACPTSPCPSTTPGPGWPPRSRPSSCARSSGWPTTRPRQSSSTGPTPRGWPRN